MAHAQSLDEDDMVALAMTYLASERLRDAFLLFVSYLNQGHGVPQSTRFWFYASLAALYCGQDEQAEKWREQARKTKDYNTGVEMDMRLEHVYVLIVRRHPEAAQKLFGTLATLETNGPSGAARNACVSTCRALLEFQQGNHHQAALGHQLAFRAFSDELVESPYYRRWRDINLAGYILALAKVNIRTNRRKIMMLARRILFTHPGMHLRAFATAFIEDPDKAIKKYDVAR